MDMNHTTRPSLRADINRHLRASGAPFAVIEKDALRRGQHRVIAEGFQTTTTDDAVNVLYRTIIMGSPTIAHVIAIRTAARILTEAGYTVSSMMRQVNFNTAPDADTLAAWGVDEARKAIVGWVIEVPTALVVTR